MASARSSGKFGLPVFINNDGDLYAFGEATGGILPWINKRISDLGDINTIRTWWDSPSAPDSA